MKAAELDRDMLARALATLPWATIGDVDALRECETVKRLQAIARKALKTADDIAFVDSTMRLERDTHEMCDNWLKAEIISTYHRKLRGQ